MRDHHAPGRLSAFAQIVPRMGAAKHRQGDRAPVLGGCANNGKRQRLEERNGVSSGGRVGHLVCLDRLIANGFGTTPGLGREQ